MTFALLAAAAVSYALLQSLVAPALPEIQRALGTSVSSVSWVLTAYPLSASIATPHRRWRVRRRGGRLDPAGSAQGGPFPSAHGFTVAFAACAIALVVGVLAGLAIPRGRIRDAGAVPAAPVLSDVAAR
ncbi:MAG: hypothetical protein QOK21_1159 [Solirubrobacteraceae bacterium]|nr:hypothetical protein [Solirubrobacteraceae bacterium]